MSRKLLDPETMNVDCAGDPGLFVERSVGGSLAGAEIGKKLWE
jgi:hypothetical protein